jgi:hypothetical protein
VLVAVVQIALEVDLQPFLERQMMELQIQVFRDVVVLKVQEVLEALQVLMEQARRVHAAKADL